LIQRLYSPYWNKKKRKGVFRKKIIHIVFDTTELFNNWWLDNPDFEVLERLVSRLNYIDKII